MVREGDLGIPKKAKPTFMALSGTRRRKPRFQGAVDQFRTEFHDVWDFEAPDRTGQPAGVLIMALKGWREFIRSVYFPKEDKILGRIFG